MIVRALTAVLFGTVALAAVEANAQSAAQTNRIATRACMSFLLSQAGQMGLDVAPGDITLSTGPGSGRGNSNRIPVQFSVDSPNVTASGTCLAITTAGNQGHVADVALNFINK